MKIDQIKKVMKKYGEAWENQDADLILECFTPNGIYQESPLATKPYKGHKKLQNGNASLDILVQRKKWLE